MSLEAVVECFSEYNIDHRVMVFQKLSRLLVTGTLQNG